MSGSVRDPNDRPGLGRIRPESTERSLFRFCPACGHSLVRESRLGKPRPRCPVCGYVQYRNPVVGVAAVIWEQQVRASLGPDACAAIATETGVLGVTSRPTRAEGPASCSGETVRAGDAEDSDSASALSATGRVLLVRRAKRYRGLWCLPCGYVEFDEEIREALVREVEEETSLRVRVREVVAVHSNFHDPDAQSVGIWFAASAIGGRLKPGDDADGLAFVDPANPRLPLAFPTDRMVLDHLSSGSLK